jgi:hypothetical protein
MRISFPLGYSGLSFQRWPPSLVNTVRRREATVMKKSSRKKKTPKRVLRLPDLDYAKAAVLNTLGSPESKRVSVRH